MVEKVPKFSAESLCIRQGEGQNTHGIKVWGGIPTEM